MNVKIIIDAEIDEEVSEEALNRWAEDIAGMVWADNSFKGSFVGYAEIVEI